MAADDHNDPSFAEMPCATAGKSVRRVRKLLAAIAIAYFALFGSAVLAAVMAGGPPAIESYVRRAVHITACIPVFWLVACVALNSLLTAVLVVEMLQHKTWPLHRVCPRRLWSDRKHFTVVLILWMCLFAGQLTIVVAMRNNQIRLEEKREADVVTVVRDPCREAVLGRMNRAGSVHNELVTRTSSAWGLRALLVCSPKLAYDCGKTVKEFL